MTFWPAAKRTGDEVLVQSYGSVCEGIAGVECGTTFGGLAANSHGACMLDLASSWS